MLSDRQGWFLSATVLVLAAVCPLRSEAENTPQDRARRTTPEDFAFDVERVVLPNGLVVILAPDRAARSVWVEMGFRAGALYEPAGRSGMAHFVEHLLATGTSSDTDYAEQSEARGAWFFNAFTAPYLMSFAVGLPPEELPFALWMMADRVAEQPARIEADLFEKERAVILVERAQRMVDRPYAAADRAILDRLFPEAHPLEGGVIGRPKALLDTTMAEVQDFIAAHIHASNGMLVVAGAFNKEVALQWIHNTVARLPPGPEPKTPTVQASPWRAAELAINERWSREPRVSLLWKMPTPRRTVREALSLGALLIQGYVDGAFGARVDAGLMEAGGETIFRLDVILPYDKPIDAARGEAEVFLRYLTAVDMPMDYFNTVRILRDLALLRALDSLRGRSRILLELEREGEDVTELAAHLGRLWRLQRHDVQHVAWKRLVTGSERLTFHARPVRPRQPRLNWEDREWGANE